jgi:hypothetical protein
MQQLLLDRRIGGHTEGKVPLRPNEAAGARCAETCPGVRMPSPLLAAPAVVEDERLAGAHGLVGQDDLELIAVGMRDEEVELDRFSHFRSLSKAVQHVHAALSS